MGACIGFKMKDAVEAFEHMDLQVVESYGDYAYGHILHTWDDGERYLCRCKNCGGYVLIQNSEFHCMTDGDDSYYHDRFPVDSPEEADELNRKYDGFQIEFDSGIRYLIGDGGPHWSVSDKE